MNLIFDFDGTLSDSLSDAVKIANKFLEKEGKKIISSNEVRQKGVKKLILESKVPKYKIPKLILFGRRKIKEKIPKQKSFKNLPQIIVKLSKSHKLGIITTNSQKNVQVFLNHSRLNYFDFIHSEIDLFGKHKKLKKIISKYNLVPKETIYIGDETRDIEAARRVGIKSIAVAWGFESEKMLQKSNPDYLALKPEDLLKIVQPIS